MNQPDTASTSTHQLAVPRRDWMAFSWGLLEAVSLFVVPDTWISRQALLSWQAGLVSAAWALVGAILGGLALYMAAIWYEAEILAFYDWLPGIGPALIAKAQTQLAESGVLALFRGGYTGTPFKLFAAQSGSAGIGPLTFVAVAVVSRGSRFIFSALLASAIGALARRGGIGQTRLLWLHAGLWTVFYAFYWTVMAE